MNIGDWLGPLAAVIVGVLTWVAARQKNRITIRELDRQHHLKTEELKQQHKQEEQKHEESLSLQIQHHNAELWTRLHELEDKSDQREQAARQREDILNTKIDRLYRRVGTFRDYANKLRVQLINNGLAPDPWPKDDE